MTRVSGQSAAAAKARLLALAPAALPVEAWTGMPFTWIGRALDRVAARGMRLAFRAALFPSESEREAVYASAVPYLTPKLARDPRQFFAFLDAPSAPVATREVGRRTIRGGVVVSRQFDTDYVPYHRSDAWPTCAENATIAVQHWMHEPGPPRATVLALHGFTMGTPWIDERVLMAARWFELGYDVALPALPFHGPRCPATARYSGELFGSWNVNRVNEAVRQAIHDVHLVKQWVAATTGRPVGLLGLSLGGYLAALMAGLSDDLAFVVPLVPPVFIDALASSLLDVDRRAKTNEAPAPIERLRAACAVHCPLTYPLAVPRERVLIVGARGDCLVPPEHSYALWRHWDEPAIHWLSGSHMAPFGRTRLLARVEAHLGELDLAA
jgi:dienelactone hydrolase